MDFSAVFPEAWASGGVVVAVLLFVFILLWRRAKRDLSGTESRLSEVEAERNELEERFGALSEKYRPISSIEDEVQRLRVIEDDQRRMVEEVRSEYAEKRKLLDKLKAQVAIFDETLSFAELGVYEPHFEFGDGEEFKSAIKKVRDRQKRMVSDKTAAVCPANWSVDGSASKGQTMVNRQMRLTMRAFNNECEAAIANTRWNNVNAMERRIENAATQIDKANESMQLYIAPAYVGLKIEELRLTHEYREHQKAEKDERAERARLEREEKKLIADAAKAEKEEQRYQELLDKARMEAGVDETRIAELEASLAEAHAAKERAQAMAEMTRSGYVYIISNIGSFGEDVVKIGLTRRLNPDDRVRELGDASVPFLFDTHAMIYSDEAPALEGALHKEFEDRRINAANMRKEFFRVNLEEVEEAVRRLAPEASFFADREAQEWHETLSRRKQMLEDMQSQREAELPETI